MTFSQRLKMLATLAAASAVPAWAQPESDRADPALIEAQIPDEPQSPRQEPQRLVASPPPGTIAASDDVVVGAIRIDGAEALPLSTYAPAIEAHVGRSLSQTELRGLATAVAEIARARGYGLATAWIPQQQVSNGILQVRIDEGRIDAVRADGDGARVAERYLAPLVATGPVQLAALERQLLLAGDAAGIWVGRAQLERENGRNILRVATRRERVQGRAALDNWGSSTIGPIRAHLSADLNCVVSDADQVAVGAAITPLDPDEFYLVRGEYSVPLGIGGWSARTGAYYARSEPSGSSRDYRGRSWEASIGLDHAIVRSRRTSAWGYLTFALRDSESHADDRRLRNDRLATVTASSYAYTPLGDSRIRGRLSIVQGLGLFDATRRGDPLASRDDGSARFTKAEAWAGYDLPLSDRVTLALEAQGQIASRPLLSSEEMGLGGRRFLRGYDYREFSGDKGIAGSAELRFDLGDLGPAEGAQIYAYADAGSVGNYEDGRGSGSLASAGGGVRFDIRRVQIGVGIGVPLAGGFAGRDRDPRLAVTIGTRF